MKKKSLYVVMTKKCNLRCAHCYVDFDNDDYNEEEFLKQLNSFEGDLILFGGEFTSDMERFRKVIKSNKEHGISKFVTATTNLVYLDDELIDFYKSLPGIATSWNLDRFGNKNNYEKWVRNLKTLVDNDVTVTILITLTKDLVELPVKEFLKIAKDFNYKDVELKFEQYVGDDVARTHYEKVDEWLCELFLNWDMESLFILSDIVEGWSYNCDETYTLHPDGTLVNKCPHDGIAVLPDDCIDCPDAMYCRPCRLIKYCSFPKKLYKLIKEKKEEEGK